MHDLIPWSTAQFYYFWIAKIFSWNFFSTLSLSFNLIIPSRGSDRDQLRSKVQRKMIQFKSFHCSILKIFPATLNAASAPASSWIMQTHHTREHHFSHLRNNFLLSRLAPWWKTKMICKISASIKFCWRSAGAAKIFFVKEERKYAPMLSGLKCLRKEKSFVNPYH